MSTENVYIQPERDRNSERRKIVAAKLSVRYAKTAFGGIPTFTLSHRRYRLLNPEPSGPAFGPHSFYIGKIDDRFWYIMRPL